MAVCGSDFDDLARLEAPEGVRFLIRSRLFSDAESAVLNPSES